MFATWQSVHILPRTDKVKSDAKRKMIRFDSFQLNRVEYAVFEKSPKKNKSKMEKEKESNDNATSIAF